MGSLKDLEIFKEATKEVKRWSINEGMSDKYEKFIERLNVVKTF